MVMRQYLPAYLPNDETVPTCLPTYDECLPNGRVSAHHRERDYMHHLGEKRSKREVYVFYINGDCACRFLVVLLARVGTEGGLLEAHKSWSASSRPRRGPAGQ